MSILRVGPWGNLNEWYKPAPFDTAIASIYYPINCALEDWPNQTWASFAITDSGFPSDLDETFSKAGLGESVSKTSDGSLLRVTPHVSFYFCYQATDAFNVNFNWSFTGEIENNNYPDLSWNYLTIDGRANTYFNTPGDSGTEIIALPEATLGIVHARVGGYAFDFDRDITVTASLSKPE
jgi:hypothetical protein